jgi:hypothetical protein
MIQYTIYANPIDYPGRYIVRRWHIDGTPPEGYRSDPVPMANVATLEEARAEVQRIDPNLVRLARDPTDDPAIVEVWL